MNPLQWLIDRGRAEGTPSYQGVRWVHTATFIALGTTVLYFTLELDKQLSRRGGRVLRAARG